MTRYVAFLRGINVSGKNRIPMKELRECCEKLGYTEVVTYLNSGNVMFSAEEGNGQKCVDDIRDMIKEGFELDVPVFVIRQDALREALAAAPRWWGTDDKEIYDNLIFVMPPADADWICGRVGQPTEGLEQISVHGDRIIYWSFDRKRYVKANWWKSTASRGIGEFLTIRTANTLKKAAEL